LHPSAKKAKAFTWCTIYLWKCKKKKKKKG